MDIDFLKWKINLAEGFGLKSEDGEDFSIWIPLKNTFLKSWCNHFRTEVWHNIYNPLLLQKAIEGINRENGRFVILQGNGFIEVLSFCKIKGLRFDLDITKEDKAKEQVLEYIYKQETK